MTITERILKGWRKEALCALQVENDPHQGGGSLAQDSVFVNEVCERILRMTQELMDQHLLRKV